ncbi:hypothetical protein FRB94_005721 [Tulasnella sp. JGI-2019a]|nr:hypothetical protein FRB94_005721 [Tulasnella sp. JGI-2019a]KAG9000919.1 hypothetical protein FRB93_012524 [Tulasnella sp. JGI-2019a]
MGIENEFKEVEADVSNMSTGEDLAAGAGVAALAAGGYEYEKHKKEEEAASHDQLANQDPTSDGSGNY